MTNLARFGVSIENELLQKYDSLLEKKGYTNRSEALRDLIRETIIQSECAEDDTDGIGTITLVYNHNSDVMDNLVNLQHEHHNAIISATHVHLDEHNCLEVLIVNGKSSSIRKIADGLIQTKGVKHGKLVMTTKGENL